MKSTIKLFLVLITLTVIVITWITGQLGDPDRQMLIAILLAFSFASFLIMNLLDRREQKKKRALRESPSRSDSSEKQHAQRRTEGSFALRDRKSGLTWGGGNIKASEATRGTKRKFLGK